MSAVVADLYAPKPWIYWLDFLAMAAIGWSAFVSACLAPAFSALQAVFLLTAAVALYRAVCFTHELAHLQRSAVPGFRFAWNLLCGIPLLIPDFLYHGIHRVHHSKNRYGTADDGEYLPLVSQAPWHIPAHFLCNLVLPGLAVLRFAVLAPLSLLWPPLRRTVKERASAMALKMDFTRELPTRDREIRRWKFQETLASLTAIAALAALWGGLLPLAAAFVWYATMVLVGTLNSLRAIGATHRYRSDEAAMGFAEQIADSVNVPSRSPLNLLLCPVGLRFHALHHLFPGLPYHSLGTAHARLMARLPADAPYRDTVISSVWAGIAQIWREASRGSPPRAAKPADAESAPSL